MTRPATGGRARLPRPGGLLVGTIVGAGISMGWLAPGAFGTDDALQRSWLVLPTVVAGARFGIPGAFVASVAAGLASGPLARLVPGGTVSGSGTWLANFVFFTAVSMLVALLVTRIREADARFVELLEEQREQAVRAAEEKGELSRELSRRVTL